MRALSVMTVVGVVLLVLKLLGLLAWSWVWVLAPFWIPVAFWFAIVLVLGFLGGLIRGRARRRRPRSLAFGR
jgi:hypothetical protein